MERESQKSTKVTLDDLVPAGYRVPSHRYEIAMEIAQKNQRAAFWAYENAETAATLGMRSYWINTGDGYAENAETFYKIAREVVHYELI